MIYIGFMSYHLSLSLLMGLIIPAGVIVIWGVFIAPKARVRIGTVAKFLLELIIFLMVGYYLLQVMDLIPIFYYLIMLVFNSILSKIGDSHYPDLFG